MANAVPASQAAWTIDPDFDAARAALSRRRTSQNGLWLVLSLAVFVWAQLDRKDTVVGLVSLVATLLIHESGHYVAMRAFGYQDVRMFFIPFFGAAVTARPRGVAAWKEGVVLLAGPIPGILLGCVLAVVSRDSLTRQISTSLLLVNGANLLPFGGLDGGRLFQRALFSRHRHLEVAFLAVTGVLLLYFALTRQLWILAVFAYLGLAVIPFRSRLLRQAQPLRTALAGVSDPAALPEPEVRALYDAARAALTERAQGRAQLVASAMEQLLDAAQPPPGIVATAGLVLTWLFGLLATLLGTVLVFWGAAPRFWHDHELSEAGIVVSMPYAPRVLQPFELTGWKAAGGLRCGTLHEYEVMAWTRERGGGEPLDGVLDLATSQVRLEGEASWRPIARAGLIGRKTNIVSSRRACKLRVVADDAHVVTLRACAPSPAEPETDRFLDSLRVKN